MIKIDELRKFLIYAKNESYVIKGDHQTFEGGIRFYNLKDGRYEYAERYISRQLDSGQ